MPIKKNLGVINVMDFGAKGDGVTDDTAAIQKAISVAADGSEIRFQNAQYLVSSTVSCSLNNLTVDFGGATIKLSLAGGGSAFSFGSITDAPTKEGLTVKNGNFEQTVPTTTQNSIYIRIAGTKNFLVENLNMKNVGNGGLSILSGCRNGLIRNVRVEGKNGYSTCRGIWVDGSGASDWASQLIDETKFERNLTALPVGGVQDVTIKDCVVKLPAYGIYLMNARNTTIQNCTVDITGAGAQRCIAVNNYSPYTTIDSCTLKSDQSSTGVLVTQFSHDVAILNSRFLGSFKGNRDVYIQYCAEVFAQGNMFLTDSNQIFEINSGGSAEIRNNVFSAPTFVNGKVAVSLNTIIPEDLSKGTAATMLKGTTVKGNVFKNIYPVYAAVSTASNGNIAGLAHISVEDNKVYNGDLFTGGAGRILFLQSSATTNKTKYFLKDNFVFPEAYNHLQFSANGTTGSTPLTTKQEFSTFKVSLIAGVVTSTKVTGGFLSCSATKGTDDILVAPRSNGGNPGASVGQVIGVTPITTNAKTFKLQVSGTAYSVKAYDDAGSLIPVTTDVEYYVHITA